MLHDRAYSVSRLLGGAKIDIYYGLCKLIPDFVVRMAVIHVHGSS